MEIIIIKIIHFKQMKFLEEIIVLINNMKHLQEDHNNKYQKKIEKFMIIQMNLMEKKIMMKIMMNQIIKLVINNKEIHEKYYLYIHSITKEKNFF